MKIKEEGEVWDEKDMENDLEYKERRQGRLQYEDGIRESKKDSILPKGTILLLFKLVKAIPSIWVKLPILYRNHFFKVFSRQIFVKSAQIWSFQCKLNFFFFPFWRGLGFSFQNNL